MQQKLLEDLKNLLRRTRGRPLTTGYLSFLIDEEIMNALPTTHLETNEFSGLGICAGKVNDEFERD